MVTTFQVKLCKEFTVDFRYSGHGYRGLSDIQMYCKNNVTIGTLKIGTADLLTTTIYGVYTFLLIVTFVLMGRLIPVEMLSVICIPYNDSHIQQSRVCCLSHT